MDLIIFLFLKLEKCQIQVYFCQMTTISCPKRVLYYRLYAAKISANTPTKPLCMAVSIFTKVFIIQKQSKKQEPEGLKEAIYLGSEAQIWYNVFNISYETLFTSKVTNRIKSEKYFIREKVRILFITNCTPMKELDPTNLQCISFS